MVSHFDNEKDKGNNIVECDDLEQFQDTIDQGHIAHMNIGTEKEVYGTTEHWEAVPVMELVTSGLEIDDCVYLMLDTHHDYYNYNPEGELTSGSWVPHAFRLGLLPSPQNPNDEVYPFILVTEKSNDLGSIMINSPEETTSWDGESQKNLDAVNDAKGGVTLIPVSFEDEIVRIVESLVLLTGKRLILNIDLDFGEVQKIRWEEAKVRYSSLVNVPWIAKLLVLSDIVIMHRSPHFNSEEHYKREEQEILEFLQSQAHD